MQNQVADGVSIHSGFPNPAADRSLSGLDLHKLLIKNQASTFFMRVEGGSWEDRGLFNGDIVVIDRAVTPRQTDLVIVTKEADFLITPFARLASNSLCWGVVTSVIHRFV